MGNYDRVLVPLDGSEISELVFEKALQLARRLESDITMLHVIAPITHGNYRLQNYEHPELVKRVKSEFGKMKDRVKDDDIEVELVVRHGLPHDEILSFGSDHDLIVMGSKGHNPLSSLILGSVAEKVVRKACCPVMLVGKNC